MTKNIVKNKKNIRILLLIWDIVTILLILCSLFLMFETVIKKLLIEASIDDYYELIDYADGEYKNAMKFLEEKKELPYKESILEILKYVKTITLNKTKFENSFVMILSDDPELNYLASIRNKGDIEITKDKLNYSQFYLAATGIPEQIKTNELNLIKNVEDKNYTESFYSYNQNTKRYHINRIPNRDEAVRLKNIILNAGIKSKKYLEFKFESKEYIAIPDFLSIPIHKTLDKNNIQKFSPLLAIADLKKDFFFIIDRARNIFFIILGIIFLIISTIKLYNTFVITNEIKEITYSILDECKAIEEKGEIGTALKELELEFKETAHLYDSYSKLSGKLVDLGEIISGIADKELFVATLKNDRSILDPHEVNMAILFLDVKGFTSIAEKYKEKAMSIVNYIWSVVESVVYKNSGKINKYIGDAALIIFPEKIVDNNNISARNAIISGIEILEKVPEIKEKLNIDFNFRIGIEYGKVVYGKTGSNRNFELGVIGDPVNTASRFESLNKQYNTNLLITDTALNQAGFEVNKGYNLLKSDNKIYYFYFIDKARPQGKKEAKEIITILTKQENGFKFLGSNITFNKELFDFYSNFVVDFLDSIKYWQKNKKEEGEKKWEELARKIAKFNNEYKFPLAEIFLNKILKYEELLRYKNNPEGWLKLNKIELKTPDDDWIKYGTIELTK